MVVRKLKLKKLLDLSSGETKDIKTYSRISDMNKYLLRNTIEGANYVIDLEFASDGQGQKARDERLTILEYHMQKGVKFKTSASAYVVRKNLL